MSIDELGDYGLVRMDDTEIDSTVIDSFLTSRGVGVLGPPTDDGPYLLPMPFGYGGDSRLYFTYLVSSGSRKASLSDRVDAASFLVYKADTRFNWESVLLTGTLEEVPESEWETVRDVTDDVWRPDLFATANLSAGVVVYEFLIDERSGVKHIGLPPGMER